jgi:arsenite methyltransferase
MKTIEIYDPPMCCSTGVCGPSIDPELARFAADLKTLQDQGYDVKRYNLAQDGPAFVAREAVKEALQTRGEAALPLVFVDGVVVASGRYPTLAGMTAAP